MDGPSTASALRVSRVPWNRLVALFFASRVYIWFVGLLSLRWVSRGPYFGAPESPWNLFTRWDASWYLDLANGGYYFTRAGEATNVVFFPLYPGLIRVFSHGGLINPKFAGYAISLSCLWIACVWLWRAVAREWNDERLATLTVAFLLFGPVSFFFSSIYSEALFLPLAIGCIDRARRGHWWQAGALGAFAALTRFIGVILIVPLVWQYMESHHRAGHSVRELRTGPIVACLLPLAGLAAYCVFMWVRFGDPLIYFHGQQYWGRRFAWFGLMFVRESFSALPLFYQIWFAATVVVAFTLLAIGVVLRMPRVYAIYGLAFGFIYISARFVEGLPRYFSVIFPLYVAVALVVRRWRRFGAPLLAFSIGLESLSVILFVNGYWFT